MRKLFCLTLIGVMLVIGPSNPGMVHASSEFQFSDVKKTDWFYPTVSKLVEKGYIGGYPDGTFKPQDNIRVSEFTKILIAALGYKVDTPKSGFWAEGYINKAKELGIIKDGEFTDYGRYITRGEMARMIVWAGETVKEKGISLDVPENYKEYSSLITDYSSLGPNSQDIALKIFVSGIITGFPDGTIGLNKNATRAEGCTILMRFLEKDQRRIPQLPKDEQIPDAASVYKKSKNGLSTLSAEELKILLDDVYPGDNLTQEWIDKYPAEKLYEYFGQKYSDAFYDYIRTSEKIVDNSTIECDISVRLSDGGTKKHRVRLKVDDNQCWSVISDETL